MGLFRRTPKPEARVGALNATQIVAEATRGRLSSGSEMVVDADSAMRHSAWWSSVELIASVGSSLPLDEFKGYGAQQVEVGLSEIFADPDPDPSITANLWRGQILRSVVARGNGYADLLGGTMGEPSGAVAVHPDCVQWKLEKNSAGGHAWQVYVDGVRRERWPNGDLWHFPLFVQPGSPVGLSPVSYHRQSIAAALSAQKFGRQFFDGSGLATVVVKVPGNPGDDQAKRLKDKILQSTQDREPLIIPDQITYDKVSIDAEDSQFLDTQRYGVEEIARIVLGGFPELIGSAVTGGGSITYANREQRMADFIALSLAPRYLIPFEHALSRLVPDGRYVKHNLDALLRSDLQGRFQAYKLNAEIAGLMGGAPFTVNDMRRLENRPPVAGGDVFSEPKKPEPTAVKIVQDPPADPTPAT